MRIAIAGKGGVGKTTLAALLCWAFKDEGQDVLAVDADPDANLGTVLGFPKAQEIVPIIQMKELIAERMGSGADKGGLFKLNPKIDDIPDKFIREHQGVKLIVMGTVKAGDSGCVCPENTFLKRLLHQIVLNNDEHIIVDFEAGLEHLGRGTASRFDHLLIVAEATKLSLDTLKRIYPLAKDIGIKQFSCVANRVRNKEELEFIRSNLGKMNLLGNFSYSATCLQANQTGDWSVLKKDKIYQEAKTIAKTLLSGGG